MLVPNIRVVFDVRNTTEMTILTLTRELLYGGEGSRGFRHTGRCGFYVDWYPLGKPYHPNDGHETE